MFPSTYVSCDYCCITFVSPFINLRHRRDFTSHTSRRGTLYIYADSKQQRPFLLENKIPPHNIFTLLYKWHRCVTAASRSILLAAHLYAFRVRRSYSESCCTFQVLRVPVQETSFFARIPGCQLSQAVESRKHVR